MGNEGAVPGEAPEGSPSSTPESAQPGATPQAGGVTPDGKTYTGEDLARIVSQRVNEINGKYKGYEELGKKPEEIKAALTRLEQIERATQGAPTTAEDRQMKELRDYIMKAIPELNNLPKIEQMASSSNEAMMQQSIQAGRTEVNRLVDETFGIKDEKSAMLVEDLVARSMSNAPEDMKRFMESGDRKLVQKHFDAVKSQLEPFFQAASAKYGATKKQQMSGVPPRMPSGGVPAPGTSSQKLNPEQRIAAAHRMLTEGQGQ